MDSPAPGESLGASTQAFVPPPSASFQLRAGALEFVTKNVFQRELYGGLISFGPGAGVLSITLPSDYSSIQIFGLAIRDQAEAKHGVHEEACAVLRELDNLGVRGVESTIHIQRLNNGKFNATIMFLGPKIAKLAVNRWRGLDYKSVMISEILPAAKAGEWIEMNAVKCTWTKTAKYAFVQYKTKANPPPRLEELAQKVSKVILPGGRRLYCTATTDPEVLRYDRERNIKSFQIRNLDRSADETLIANVLVNEGFLPPSKIKIRNIDEDWKEGNDGIRAAHVQNAFQLVGPIETFKVRNSNDGAKSIADVVFYNSEDASRAVDQLHGKLLKNFPTKNLLEVQRYVNIKFNVPKKIAEALRTRLILLQATLKRNGYDRLKIHTSDSNKKYVTLRFSDTGPEAISAAAEAKARIESMLAGTVITETYKIRVALEPNATPQSTGEITTTVQVALWHPWFATTKALSYFTELSHRYKLYIHRGKDQLVLYGGKYENRRDVCGMLRARHRDLNLHVIEPKGDVGIPQILEKLKKQFGDNLLLDSTSGSTKVLLRGSLDDLQKVSKEFPPNGNIQDANYVRARSILFPKDANDSAEDCVICYTPPDSASETVKLGCGHTYCKECLLNGVKNLGHLTDQIPLKCSGLDGECAQIMSLEILRDNLPIEAFNTLLRLSFQQYFRARPLEFACCTTIDCESVYRPATADNPDEPGTTIVCTQCLSSICASCKAASHPGMSCRRSRGLVAADEAFEQSREENRVRNCPGCNVLTQKSGGCNHFYCMHCRTHWCFVCLEIFPNKRSTDYHLIETHGSMGIEEFDGEGQPAFAGGNLNFEGGQMFGHFGDDDNMDPPGPPGPW